MRRSDYLTSFLSCIDLLSIAPFYISLFLDPSSTAFMVMSSLRYGGFWLGDLLSSGGGASGRIKIFSSPP